MAIIYAAVFAVCFFSSIIGAICGIGGGVIIKPVLDALGVFPVSTINFLSGCTVLSMTAYSVLRSRVSGASQIDFKTATPLAIGAAVGGLVGKDLFSMVEGLFDTPNTAGAVQAAVLMVITIGTLVYTVNKEKIATKRVSGALACAVIGLFLGIMSSFLGIGGGPINLVSFIISSAWKPRRPRRTPCISSCSHRLRALFAASSRWILRALALR